MFTVALITRKIVALSKITEVIPQMYKPCKV